MSTFHETIPVDITYDVCYEINEYIEQNKNLKYNKVYNYKDLYDYLIRDKDDRYNGFKCGSVFLYFRGDYVYSNCNVLKDFDLDNPYIFIFDHKVRIEDEVYEFTLDTKIKSRDLEQLADDSDQEFTKNNFDSKIAEKLEDQQKLKTQNKSTISSSDTNVSVNYNNMPLSTRNLKKKSDSSNILDNKKVEHYNQLSNGRKHALHMINNMANNGEIVDSNKIYKLLDQDLKLSEKLKNSSLNSIALESGRIAKLFDCLEDSVCKYVAYQMPVFTIYKLSALPAWTRGIKYEMTLGDGSLESITLSDIMKSMTLTQLDNLQACNIELCYLLSNNDFSKYKHDKQLITLSGHVDFPAASTFCELVVSKCNTPKGKSAMRTKINERLETFKNISHNDRDNIVNICNKHKIFKTHRRFWLS